MTPKIHPAWHALDQYCRTKGEFIFGTLETEIIDLMADLLHLAQDEGYDSINLLRLAQMHYQIETGEGTDTLCQTPFSEEN